MAKNTSVVLGERYDKFIAQLIQDGRYASASEVLREGLRLVEEREQKFDALRVAAERGDVDAQALIDELR
ncbi:type II toxin-antitoxin system ParD family antitoxin [Corynebacterium fournieri]|uniref:type II toxin-antitoxin system ParD family antitoxin n=1 Tax=Corynebacterium fournieri TaxID=1852390 RepID=UPI000A2F833A|nr:type II toxin-antitoxin system ParD family antitoxin [Corynebacterium fournieri]WJY97042.1 Antitoxin ParD1 [Corynebacterium fournieri]